MEARVMSFSLEKRVQSFIRRVETEGINLYGFMLSVNGKRKASAYYAPFREGQPHRMYSVSKTMTGLAVGLLAEEGKLSLDQSICDFFPDLLPEDPDPRLLRQTVRDMLRMATCYRATVYREREDQDWTRPFFTGVPTHEPGTVFHYDTGCSQVLAALVRRLSGLEVIDFLGQKLFDPLNLRDQRFWLRDPSGCCQGGTGLCMSLRDLHRVGECLLSGGEGLLPAWFIREMSKKQIDTLLRDADEEKFGYGWQCWQTRKGWSMYGMGGQLCVLVPEERAVWTTIADTRLDPCGVQKLYDAFYEELEPWLGTEDMEETYYTLSLKPLPHEPAWEKKAAGPFRFNAGNALGLRQMKLEGHRLIYEQARGEVVLPFAPGQILETAFPGWPDVPALVASGWAAPDLLRLRCHAIGTAPCGFDLLLHFGEDCLTVQSMRSWDPLTDGYDGVASSVKD
jgi:CubicO group peptidase (beta-lactamase class C family)